MVTVPHPGAHIAFLLVAAIVAACGSTGSAATPPPSPGTSGAPRDVNIVAREYSFSPPVVDLVPGETVLLHLVNGGLDVHDMVIGDAAVQDAWEDAEAGTEAAPPGPTPVISVPPGLEGLRVVLRSGERVDVIWTVPTASLPGASPVPLIVGCHIPGHWARGMQVPIHFVGPGGSAPSGDTLLSDPATGGDTRRGI